MGTKCSETRQNNKNNTSRNESRLACPKTKIELSLIFDPCARGLHTSNF